MIKFTLYIILIFNLELWSLKAFSQNKTIDSLNRVLLSSEIDTIKVNTLNSLAWELRTINPDSSTLLTQQALNLISNTQGYSENWNQIAEARSWFQLGDFNLRKGDYSAALECGLKALTLCEKLEVELPTNQLTKLKGLKSLIIGNIGAIYKDQGEYNTALDNYFKGLRIDEELNNQNGIAQHLCNIGNIYYSQGETDKALEYYFKVLKISEHADVDNRDAFVLGNIGNVYLNTGNYNKALEYNFMALEKHEELRDKDGIAFTLGNIGIVYHSMGDYKKALENHLKALDLGTELKDKKRVSIQLHSLGMLYVDMKKIKEARDSYNKSLLISKEIGWKDGTIVNYYRLSNLESEVGNFKEAYKLHLLYIAYSDSVSNEANLKMQTRLEMNFEFEKKEALAKAEQEKKDALTKEQIDQQRMQRNYFMAGFGLVLLIAFMIFRGYRNKIKANKIISDQKIKVDKAYSNLEEKNRIIETKNKEILDSINYAKHIQSAILPPQKLVKKYLENSFILYKPKDIVAGDFYWMETVNDDIFFAAADCTGHGVPGAMVSVMCSNALTRAVKELGILKPAKILDKVVEILEERFGKSEEEVSDGMDVALCSLNTQTLHLQYSGANNPLWLIRENQIIEYKANKQPVGKFDNRVPFTNHEILLQKGDSVFLFSDGYADQFGGEKGKKFLYSRLKETLLSLNNLSMPDQKERLLEVFNTWKGDLEQVDDVCVIGVRV